MRRGAGHGGFIVAALTMMGILLKLPIGTSSDVVNRSRLMLIGVLAFGLPPFVYSLLPDLEVHGVLGGPLIGHGRMYAVGPRHSCNESMGMRFHVPLDKKNGLQSFSQSINHTVS